MSGSWRAMDMTTQVQTANTPPAPVAWIVVGSRGIGAAVAYCHQWRPGDSVIWDDWQTMHSVTSLSAYHRRVMHRVTLATDHETGRYIDPTAAPPLLPIAGRDEKSRWTTL
ncbi:MAG: TauD/TfdA family dioxygenase [Deltaproteobacteria bacterium]|jgi:hypothetical protein|nr:TauD/TfdA family dioxygenase [Deltaproteobacteria bacterium]MBW2499363.1 TauD/TfdA family dioxygenase [Deltaproteobacteria bacterium]